MYTVCPCLPHIRVACILVVATIALKVFVYANIYIQTLRRYIDAESIYNVDVVN